MKSMQEQYEKARAVMPGGVNSSTRLSKALGTPFFASRGKGSRIWDIQGRQYIDMCCAHGAGLLGLAHPEIDRAVTKAIELGYLNSFETEYHEELAGLVCAALPCAEKVRFCSSGSEATLHLIRGCRGYTGRKKIIRIEGHFHGYHELIYIGGHPPREAFQANRKKPYIESAGIPSEFADLIVPVPFNDEEALIRAVEEHGSETALLIAEPVNYNCGCIKPLPGYLELMRKLTNEAGIILFFDEIQSAFKKSPGGAQEDFGVVPDVCTIGKSLGGGLPLSAFCGRAEIMDAFKPAGPVQHSGTFNAHLIPVLAGIAFLKEIRKPDFYPRLRSLEEQFHSGMDKIIKTLDLTMTVPHHGARFDIIFGRKEEAQRYQDTFCHDPDLMVAFVKECFEEGIYFHDYGGAPVHHGYSIQHSNEDIAAVLNVIEKVFKRMRSKGAKI